MICQRCKQPINHKRGDMIVKLRCEGHEFQKMVFCLKCGMDFLDWVEPPGDDE